MDTQQFKTLAPLAGLKLYPFVIGMQPSFVTTTVSSNCAIGWPFASASTG